MNSDLQELMRAASYVAEIAPTLEAAARSVDKAESSGQGHVAGRASLADTALANGFAPLADNRAQVGAQDPGSLATEISRLTDATRAAAAVNAAIPRSTSSAPAESSDSGIAGTLLRTAAMMTGVGPVVMGLMKLFGSSEPEALPPLEKFQAPAPVSVEAGLTSNRDFGSIRHAQGGTPDVLPGAASQANAQTIQVNIQAMDSQSFLDRQDDIARAVREAMLHSNSLNDVVMEL